MNRGAILSAIACTILLLVLLAGCRNPQDSSPSGKGENQAVETSDSATATSEAVPIKEESDGREGATLMEAKTAGDEEEQAGVQVDGVSSNEQGLEDIIVTDRLEEGKSAVEYLRAKGYNVMAKDNFIEPRLVLETDVPGKDIRFTFNVCVPNENGVTAIVTGDTWENKDQAILYYDRDGKLINRLEVGDRECVFSGGSKGAVVVTDDEDAMTATLVYYDEVGKEKWSKDIKYSGYVQRIDISYYGNSICFMEGITPYEETGMDDPTERVLFLDNNGNEVLDLDKTWSLLSGDFSLDGKRYAGLFSWQSGQDFGAGLVNIDLDQGKVARRAPFGYYSWVGHDMDYLAVSENGSFIAAIDLESTYILQEKLKNEDPANYSDMNAPEVVSVFDKSGRKVASVISRKPYGIDENGMLFSGDEHTAYLVDTANKLIISSFKDSSDRVLNNDASRIINYGNHGYRLCLSSFLVNADYVVDGHSMNRLLDLDGNICWDPGFSIDRWTDDGGYLTDMYPYAAVWKVGE